MKGEKKPSTARGQLISLFPQDPAYLGDVCY